MKKYMFGDKKNKITDSERSLISETVSIEGTINSSGAIDVAGLVKGPVFSKEIIIRETGSVTGSIESLESSPKPSLIALWTSFAKLAAVYDPGLISMLLKAALPVVSSTLTVRKSLPQYVDLLSVGFASYVV